MSGVPIHVIPENDERGHVSEGPLCPCLPRVKEDGMVILHNSYDGREIGQVCANALDAMGLALSKHHHQWSDDLRDKYEHAIQLLEMHFQVDGPPHRGWPA